MLQRASPVHVLKATPLTSGTFRGVIKEQGPFPRQDKHNLNLLRRVVALEALPEAWRDYFLQRLVQFTGS